MPIRSTNPTLLDQLNSAFVKFEAIFEAMWNLLIYNPFSNGSQAVSNMRNC